MKGHPVRTPERVAEAQRLRAEGRTYREIGEALGVAKNTAAEWITDPDRSKWRARRESYAGACIDCGAPTDGSSGPVRAAERCRECVTWTQESALLAVEDYFETHGAPPRSRIPGLPHVSTARRLFGSWNNLLLAAGLPLVCDRRADVWESAVQRVLDGELVADIAAERGCTESNIYQVLCRRGVRLHDVRRAAA